MTYPWSGCASKSISAPYDAIQCTSRVSISIEYGAVPAGSAQRAADDLIDAGVKIIFNYSEALLDVPADVAVHASNPAVELLYALYFHLT